MRKLWWIWAGLLAGAAAWGCGGGRLIPQDIEKMMDSEGGRWALKAIEGHGGIWTWRRRPFAKFDYAKLAVARGFDTVVTNRRRDTSITPRVDTLTNLRENIILDLDSGFASARSASQAPLVLMGRYGDSIWIVRDGVPGVDSIDRGTVATHLSEAQFHFGLPFVLLDTTLRFTLEGDLASVDTVIQKGKEPGTFDTTWTDYTLKKLKVDFGPDQAPYPWLAFFLDERDGRIRRVLEPVAGDSGTEMLMITVWSDIQDVLGLRIGGRRVSYPADRSGAATGPYLVDRRYYGIEFPRRLEETPFTWTPAPVDTSGTPES